jgi:hypothetical protein
MTELLEVRGSVFQLRCHKPVTPYSLGGSLGGLEGGFGLSASSAMSPRFFKVMPDGAAAVRVMKEAATSAAEVRANDDPLLKNIVSVIVYLRY